MAKGNLTELDAVNRALVAVNQTPLSSLGQGTHALGAVAEIILDEVVQEVQAEGWWFNTEYSVTYTPNSSNEIELGDDVLAADGSSATSNYIKRGNRLYDLDNHTKTFTSDVELDVIKHLDWADLPLLCKAYMAARVASRIMESYDRDTGAVRNAQGREELARQKMLQEDTKQADANMLTDDPTVVTSLSGSRGVLEGRA